ncbi:hypothetical protein [Tenacibaculum jejuense]|uniref:Lipoprotein n=1 Tax=Tenacibaculum jejuense TaxID=584609 RepID=A0A238U6I5_9FLAO|nr:hypothetical protein [Tenacibaculum jejuense]SNR14712.1 exported protein of unknown function [Tenacibaculum jejuense]
MRFTLLLIIFLLIHSNTKAQNTEIKWYSESNNNGIILQNSFPKGGLYKGSKKEYFNYSCLVFFSRVINQTKKTVELTVDFPTDKIGIPNSPNTFVKLFLSSDKMSLEKQSLFNYGLTDFDTLDDSTIVQKTIQPNEDHLFYVIAIFFQTKNDAKNENRGGNRTELVLREDNLYYKMLPQIELMHCGKINFID